MTDIMNDPVILGVIIFAFGGFLLIVLSMFSGTGGGKKREVKEEEKKEVDRYEENRKNRFAMASLKRKEKEVNKLKEETEHTAKRQEVQEDTLSAVKEQIKATEGIFEAKEIRLQAGAKEVNAQRVLGSAEGKEVDAQNVLLSASKKELLTIEARIIVERDKLAVEKREKIAEIGEYKAKIVSMLQEMKNEKDNWNLTKREDHLALYSRELKHFSKTIDDTYALQTRELKLKEKTVSSKAEKLELKKERNEIERLYKDDRLVLRQIGVKRGEMKLFEKDLSRKMEIISAGEEGMYMRADLGTRDAYNQSGYYPDTRLMEENQYLKNKVEELKSMLPHEI